MNRKELIRAVRIAATEAGLDCPGQDGELGIVFLGRNEMRRTNREFLGHDWVTDVITFDLAAGDGAAGGGAATIGEILVCPDQARDNAAVYGTHPAIELMLYIVHGLLHLGGLDDQTEAEGKRMRKAEARVMAVVQQQVTVTDILEFKALSDYE